MFQKMTRFFKQKKTWWAELSPYLKKARECGKTLKPIAKAKNKISDSDILLFVTVKDELHRMNYFIDYYRNLGVKRFYIVDNGSSDGTLEFLSKQHDVTCYVTHQGYKDSNFGMHWLNYLLRKYGKGHWCITCDPDEFIVYPYMESRKLKDLISYLESIQQRSFFTVMLDMYSDKPISETYYTSGDSPLDACPYFDGTGYSKQYNHNYRNLFVQGGVRRRVFAKEQPETAPALNKVPLVKWKWNYVYISSMHMMLPRVLNRCVDDRIVTGALLHFKFINQLNDKVKTELEAKQHYNDSAEYKQYGDIINKKDILYDNQVSVKFSGWEDLRQRGIINVEGW